MWRHLAEAAVAAVLLGAALAKARRPRAAAEALATFGVPDGARRPALAGLVAVELGLAAGVAAGATWAALATAALGAAFALALTLALARGRGGAPCGCFGARSRVGAPAVARALALAALAAAVPFLPDSAATTDAWLALGLGIALAAIAALAVAVAALARELGRLRADLAPSAALELPDEGPELGSRPAFPADAFAPGPDAQLALAVFSSPGCPLCAALNPAVQAFGRDPLVALAEFDEHDDPDVWRALGVPGSPYAVALSLDGVALAKGTFNTPSQLEGILAAAERRRREALVA